MLKILFINIIPQNEVYYFDFILQVILFIFVVLVSWKTCTF